MKRNVYRKITGIFLIFVLIISALTLSSCNRSYDEDEVKEATKALLKDAEVLNMIYYGSGIKYYEERKAREKEYVRSLAQKYNAEEYCEMCIRLGRPIRYYCGYIILYQEYPFIDKWKKQLKKLK